MNLKQVSLIVVIAIVCFLTGKFSSPSKVEIREVEKVVYKESETKDRNLNTNETIKETRLPDGTVITEKVKTKEYETHTAKNKQSETEKVSIKTTENRPNYRLGIVYEPAVKSFQEVRYTGLIEKRLFGEFYLGLSGSSEKTFGLTFSFGF